MSTFNTITPFTYTVPNLKGVDGKSLLSIFDRRVLRNKDIVNDCIFPFWKENVKVTIRFNHVEFAMTLACGMMKVEADGIPLAQTIEHPKKFIFELFRDPCTLIKIRKILIKDARDAYSSARALRRPW